MGDIKSEMLFPLKPLLMKSDDTFIKIPAAAPRGENAARHEKGHNHAVLFIRVADPDPGF